jgi:hypothetical protein
MGRVCTLEGVKSRRAVERGEGRGSWQLFERFYRPNGSNRPSPLITATKENTKEATKDKGFYTKDMFTR